MVWALLYMPKMEDYNFQNFLPTTLSLGMADLVLFHFQKFESYERWIYRSYRFSATSAGNVPGSSAIYAKTVDAGVLLARKLTAWDKTVLWTNYRLIEAQRNPRTVSEESIIYDSTGAGLSTKSTIEYDGDLTQTDTPLNVKRSTSYAFAVVSGGTSIMPNSAPAASPTQGVTLTATRISETDFLYTSTDPNLASLKTACGNQNMRFLPITSRVNSPNGIIQSQSKINYDDVNYSTFGRCNATSASVWDSTKGLVTDTNAYLTTRAKFDIYNEPQKLDRQLRWKRGYKIAVKEQYDEHQEPEEI